MFNTYQNYLEYHIDNIGRRRVMFRPKNVKTYDFVMKMIDLSLVKIAPKSPKLSNVPLLNVDFNAAMVSP